jgi:hypothetical protein
MAGTPACVDLMESTMGPTDPRCGPHGPFVDLMKSTMATCGPIVDLMKSTMTTCGPIVDLMKSTMTTCGPIVDLMKSTMATCDPRYDRGWLSALRSKNVRISSSRSPSSTPSTSDVFTSVR